MTGVQTCALPIFGFRDGRIGLGVLGLFALKMGVDAWIQARAARAVARWQGLPVPHWPGSQRH